MKNRKVSNTVLKLFCLLSICCSFSCESFQSRFEPISDNDIEITRNNCRDLVLPDAFVNKISDKQLVKMASAIYTTQYRSSIDPKTVEEHFYNQLIPQGWKYTRLKELGQTSWYFEKGKFSIIIEYGIIGFSSDGLYSVNCKWGTNRLH